MNHSLKTVLWDAVKVSRGQPAFLLFMAKALYYQYAALKNRLKHENQGVHVPPFIILSVTSKCNLNCQGCFAKAQKHKPQNELKISRINKIFKEAVELGTSIFLIIGGEPLLRTELFDVTKLYPQIIFPVFTNGIFLNKEKIKLFKQQRQLIPIISIEGDIHQTDERRGKGIYQNFLKISKDLQKNRLFFGVSLTITRKNFKTVTSVQYINSIVKTGCKLFFFVEFIPTHAKSENLVLTKQQKKQILTIMKNLRKKFPALFIAFPGDEEQFGGCLAAGRGFVHINSEGNVEPCPFSPYADTNLNKLSLKEALQSKFLQEIRENHHKLTETKSGCALWENRDWVESIL